MEEENIKIQYIDKESKDYIKTYSNSIHPTVNMQEDIVINFYEESVQPRLIIERPLEFENDDEVSFTRSKNDLLIDRELKASITLNREKALDLAEWITEKFSEEENEEEGEDDDNN
ncbi:hypothetical protein MKY85_17615 [Paenibacillus sp. FSL R5-0749]|uniref:hypothetical protein n=1 Tax=Paenibacillus sp. FSL R5-0749 TaxID=2921657 RepID=UPI00315B032A